MTAPDNPPAAFDMDEAFWVHVRTLPDEIKDSAEVREMLMLKCKIQMMNRSIEEAIILRVAGWKASLPNGPLDPERIFAWQWRRPGPKGGTLFLSTNQAINALNAARQRPAQTEEGRKP